MKRLCAWCLALGMACGTVATAEAADIRAKGVWDFLGEWSNVAPRNDRNDRFGAMQRLRTQVDVIASKALKGVLKRQHRLGERRRRRRAGNRRQDG